MSDPNVLPYLAEPLGPGTGNFNNLDGSPMSVFQPGEQHITGTAISTVFNALLGTFIPHELSLLNFSEELQKCLYIIQVYDNSRFVAFACIRRTSFEDMSYINIPLYAYGHYPYGQQPYPGVAAPSYSMFGEVSYVWQDPTYSGDYIGLICFAYLLDKFLESVGIDEQNNPLRDQRLLVIIPETIPSDDLYTYCTFVQANYFQNTDYPSLIGTIDFSISPYRGLNTPCQIYTYDGTVHT